MGPVKIFFVSNEATSILLVLRTSYHGLGQVAHSKQVPLCINPD